jgi:hypothetical protein
MMANLSGCGEQTKRTGQGTACGWKISKIHDVADQESLRRDRIVRAGSDGA